MLPLGNYLKRLAQLGDTSDSGQPQASGKPRIFYGWWLVLLASLVVLVTYMPLWIWFVALEEHFMWSRTQLSMALTISGVFSLLAVVVGYLTDRFGPRRLVLPGLCIVAAGFVIFGLTQNLPTYYASFITITIGRELCGSIPLLVMLSHWFARRRTVAIATYLAIPPVLSLALVPLITWSIDPQTAGAGWRSTAFIMAGAVAFVVAVALPRMRNTPGEMGLQPDGNAGLENQARQTEFSLGEALRSRTFWYITLGYGLASASFAAGNTAKSAQIADASFLTLVSSVASFVSASFYLVGGLAGDRFSKYRVMALFAVVQALGILVMILAQDNIPIISLALVLMYAGAGCLRPLSLAIMPDYFGTGSLGSILAVQGLIVGLVTVATTFPAYQLAGGGAYFLGLLFPLALTLLAAFLFLKSVSPPRSPSLSSPLDEKDWTT